MFDVAAPQRVPSGPMRNFFEGADWAILVEPREVVASLQSLGFDAATFGSCGSQGLPEGLVGYLARIT
jgi:hypothetical protein